jgi:integrase
VGRGITGTLRKRGKNWTVQWTEGGERKFRNLGPVSKREAEDLRDQIIKPLQLRREKDRLATAQKRLSERKQELGDERQAVEQAEVERNRPSIADAWSAFIDSTNRPDSGESTLRQYGFQWQAFVKWLGKSRKEVGRLADITPAMGQDYARHLRDRKLAAGTFNKHVALCKLVIGTLSESERVTVNPFDKVKRRRENQQHRRELAWDKLCEICEAAKGEMKTLLFLGIYTGQRLGNCCLLTWDEVDLTRGWITTVPRKTRNRNAGPIHIPVLDHLRPLLEATPPGKRKGYLLPELAALYLKNRDLVTDRVQALFKSCGVQVHKPGTGRQKDENGNWVSTGKRAVLQYGYHSLRHTTVTLLQEAGVPQAVVQAVVGHRTLAMTQKYTHVGKDAIREGMGKLPAMQATEVQGLLSASDKEGVNALEALKAIRRKLQTATADNWEQVVNELLGAIPESDT